MSASIERGLSGWRRKKHSGAIVGRRHFEWAYLSSVRASFAGRPSTNRVGAGASASNSSQKDCVIVGVQRTRGLGAQTVFGLLRSL
jgi:hypothetical protein